MLKGKVALVTGASRGIGKEIAISLAKEGAIVVVNYNGSKDKAEEVVFEITSNGGEAISYGCDVSDYSKSEIMIKEIIAKLGRIDILVNNAGITKDGLLMKMSEEDFDKVININLKGTFNMIKHLSRSFLKQKSGRIINISSVVGITGNAGQANYCASKAGVLGLTKSVARELGKRGITVNAVAPGFIDTDMTEFLDENSRKSLLSQIPLDKIGKTIDVANTVCFLASDKASYITGQCISVDGGMSM